MLTRRTAHRPFDPARTVSEEQRRRLANSFEIEDLSVHFVTERGAIEQLAALEARADAALLARREYRDELAQWIGAGASGTPWLASKIGQFAAAHLPISRQVAHADAGKLASAPLVALLVTRHNRRLDQLRAGEAYIRVALTAEAHALRVQPVSQTLQLAETCAEVSALFGAPECFAQHLFRIGEGDAETRRPPRRPLESMLIRTQQPA